MSSHAVTIAGYLIIALAGVGSSGSPGAVPVVSIGSRMSSRERVERAPGASA
jgi:hypothetical protein